MALYCTSPFLCPFVRINFENNKFDLKKKEIMKNCEFGISKSRSLSRSENDETINYQKSSA